LPTVFTYCRKKDVSALKKNYTDIEFFTKEFEPKYISKDFSLLAENKEVFEEIIQSKNVMSLFKKIENYILCIYLTDRKLVSKEYNLNLI
jgi:hypothetical protein